MLIEESTCDPNWLVIQSCSSPWLTVPHASAPDTAATVSDAAELVSGTTPAALLAAPNAKSTPLKSAATPFHEVVKSPSRVLTSAPNVGSTLDSALMIGSTITSNSSACAGATPHGPVPNANTAPALVPQPTTRRRRALALPDWRFRLLRV